MNKKPNTETESGAADAHSFRLENGLLRLVESLERKREDDDWIDSLIVRESNDTYDFQPDQSVRY